MQLAIPHAPRPASLRQVPGAVRRVAVVAAVCVAFVTLAGVIARGAMRWVTDDARFASRAETISGTLVKVDGSSRSEVQAVSVIYRFQERQHSAVVEMETLAARALGKGAAVSLLIDPAQPDRPRERGTVEARATRGSLVAPVVGISLVAAALFLAREIRRALRREVEPLRTGLLVWLTPDAPLPETKAPISFQAHYFRDDVKHAVIARADGRRRPVRNGDKVLAAVAPREPTWVRVVDEEVAQSLGWYR